VRYGRIDPKTDRDRDARGPFLHGGGARNGLGGAEYGHDCGPLGLRRALRRVVGGARGRIAGRLERRCGCVGGCGRHRSLLRGALPAAGAVGEENSFQNS